MRSLAIGKAALIAVRTESTIIRRETRSAAGFVVRLNRQYPWLGGPAARCRIAQTKGSTSSRVYSRGDVTLTGQFMFTVSAARYWALTTRCRAARSSRWTRVGANFPTLDPNIAHG
jgi:hypothetical protein